jgi:hypothetical protein
MRDSDDGGGGEMKKLTRDNAASCHDDEDGCQY